MDNRIIIDLKENYGLTCNQITPITGGFMNLKWKITTVEKGGLLVKQYSTKRFRRAQLEWIEFALQRQIILEQNGVSCPFIRQYKNNAIRFLDDEIIYMVMDFHSGKTQKPDTITITQMRSLGSACGIMHKEFSQLPEPEDKSLPGFGGYTIDALWENFNWRMSQCPPDVNPEYKKALLATEPILKQLNSEFFDKFPKGFSHEDFQSGNILFDANNVIILDFDRNSYSYIWHDIGRAILSFALENDKMNVGKVCAFLEGYSQYLPLTLSNIADALRLSWCIEVPWWIQPEFFGEDCGDIPKRFKEEILWLTKNWVEIDFLIEQKGI